MGAKVSKRAAGKMESKKELEKVGYLGPTIGLPEGKTFADTTTFGYMAAQKHFQHHDNIEYMNFPSHEAICVAVASQEIAYGVVAVENSIAGFVAETIRAIKDSDIDGGVHIQAEVMVPIELYYMSKGTSKAPPRAVISHAVALAQCDEFVQSLKHDGIDTEVRRSTGAAAYEASCDPTLATIASARAEVEYGLTRIKQHSVTDSKEAETRFWVLSKKHAVKTGKDKTAILVELKQEQSGALYRALGCFVASQEEENLFRLKPSDRPNLLYVFPVPITGLHQEYTFLMEFTGHVTDQSIHEGLRSFAKSGLMRGPARFIGSYPDTTSRPPKS